MVAIPPCPVCTGRRPYCIHRSYALPRPADIEKRVQERLSKEFLGPSYSVFVGHVGYPSVNIGPMAGLEERPAIDSPQDWFGMSYAQIIELRSLLVRSKQQESVFSRSRLVLETQELALAKQPADTEIIFRKTPVYHFQLSESLQPMGPSGSLERLKIVENVRVAPAVEKIVSDDLKAREAAFQLYQQGQDVYKVTAILSTGALGLGQARKLVPTRWSITATDDIVAKRLMEEVRDFPALGDYLVFESLYMDNHFVVLLMPGGWEFENFEVWASGSNWSAQTQSRIIGEYEPFEGRTAYAESQAGGYYASRIGVVEYLHKVKKQARVVVFREVSEGYVIPLGVWQVRENVRNAMRQKPVKFSTKEDALAHIRPRLKIPLEEYRKKSVVLKQRKLWEF